MNWKKEIFTAAAVFMLGTGIFCAGSACAGEADESSLKIVTTIYPEYDWVMQILGGRAAEADVTMLLDKGVDLHSYQPTVDDILTITTCDLFLYVGGESDQWVESALQESINPDLETVSLLQVLGEDAKEEAIVEGMQEDEPEDASEDEPADTPEYDEHVWLSLRNARILVDAIAQRIAALDPENESLYLDNAAAYQQKLQELDQKYRDAAERSELKTLLFADRFPFRYLTDDYGLSYYAAFAGCSAETEASFETVIFLAQKVDELGLGTILTIDGSDGKIAETVRENTMEKDQQILMMDSMQATKTTDGTTYLAVMESNLEILQRALSAC